MERVTYLKRAAEARRHVPEVIRLLLAITGRSSKELAQALGISSGRLSERLSGKVRISSEEIAVCALFLGVEEGLLYRDPTSFRAALMGSGPTVHSPEQVITGNGYFPALAGAEAA